MQQAQDSKLSRILAAHEGGKIEIQAKFDVQNKDDLALVYTPGVAQVCNLIGQNKEKANEFTLKKNTVAVFSNGTAILGLGDLGPEAAIPVMEGKAMLFKTLAGVDAFPICIHGKTADEVMAIAKAIEPVFGGFNLEDIAAPECFEIEQRLQQELSVPVMHDDQHGTAVVALAALFNALKIVNKKIDRIKIVVSGAGAAGIACSKLFLKAGVLPENLIVCDRGGAIFENRKEHMNREKIALSQTTNSNKCSGSLKEVLADCDVFLGVSGPNLLNKDDIKTMAEKPIVFALSNPIPEILPTEISDIDGVVATGRSDFPNQINNVLVFPGFFRGLLDSKARNVTDAMKLAAAKAISELVSASELNKNYIIPDALDKRAVKAVAGAVIEVNKEKTVL